MDESERRLAFEVIGEADIPELTRVMTRAFDHDTQIHLGEERGGPDGYDNGDFLRNWLFGYEESEGHKVVCDEQTIGAVIVWILPRGHNVLGTVFVDPEFQSQGIGTQIWCHVEARYPGTRSWRLETPDLATRNHYFYEAKCGFQRVETDPVVGASDGMVIYRKDMGPEDSEPPLP